MKLINKINSFCDGNDFRVFLLLSTIGIIETFLVVFFIWLGLPPENKTIPILIALWSSISIGVVILALFMASEMKNQFKN